MEYIDAWQLHLEKDIVNYKIMEKIFTLKLDFNKSIKNLGGIFCFVLISLVLGYSELAYSEGTKQLIPDPTKNQGAIQIWDGGAGSAALRTFLTYNSNNSLKRLNIKICNSGEKVYLGILAENNDVFFRVKDKDGNTVQLFRVSTSGGTSIEQTVRKPNNYTSLYVNGSGSIINASAASIAAPNQFTYRMAWMSTMTGFIQNYAQAAAGPAVSAVALANGYSVANGYKNAFFFTATNPGDYYVEANPVFPDSVVAAGTFSTMSNRRFPFFDITVTDPSNKIVTGRVWSGFWDLTCYSFTNIFNGSFFVYTTDSIVTKLTMNNIQPFGFIVMCNSFGLTNTGNFVKDRQSRAGIFQSPEYKLFLNDPDNSCYPSGRFGQLNSAPNITGCDVNNRCININVDKAGKAQVILQLSKITPALSPPLVDRAISWDLKVGNNCVLWDTKDGAGTIVPAGVVIPTRVDYFTGITHFPMYDCERNLQGYSVSLTRPKVGGVPIPYMFWDDTQIPVATTQRANSKDATVYPGSPNIPASWPATLTITSPVCGVGTFLDGTSNGYNAIKNIITTSAGQCFTAPPISCSTAIGCMNGLQVLNDVQGCVNSSGCHLWNWNANNSTSADYGNVNTINMWWYANILTTAAGFNPGYITVDAETRIPRTTVNGKIKVRDTTVCSNNNVYGLKGLVTSTGFVGTVSGVWRTFLPKSTGGKFYKDAAGTVEDSSYAGAAFYIPSATDLARDSAKVYLYANNNICPTGALDSLIIRYSPSPQIKITAPTTVCANNSTINLSANLTVAGGLVWGGIGPGGAALTGTFSPPTSLTPTYTLGAGEAPTSAPARLFIFTATTTGNGKCNPVISTQVTVTVNPAFTVSVPGSTLICATQPNQPLNAKISNGITTTTGLWSTNGSGKFSNGLSTSTVLNTTYTFSANDVSNNGVTLSLISTGNGSCNASSGNVVISMYKAPTALANAGPTVCENNPAATLSGSVTNATSTLWTFPGVEPNPGTFTPSASVLGITYTPSTAQIAINKPLATSVTLELQAALAGCITAKSQTTITINRAPTVSAGPSQFVCANNPTVTLSGTITPSATGEGTGATWSGGGGSFFPSSNITSTTTGVTYTLSPAEIAAGNTILTLRSTGNGSCTPVTSTVTIFVTAAPSITPLSNVKACANNPVVTLTGTVSLPFSGTWSSGGTGTISGAGTTAVYKASNTDVTNGSVPLTFTSTSNGQCKAVSQTISLTFDASPVVTIGSNKTVCSNNPSVVLNGGVSGGASGVNWLGGNTGGFNPSRTSLTPTYTPTAAEIASGLMTLSITSTGNLSNCFADTKAMTIAFTPAPTVNPGSPFTVCANNPNISLAGKVQIGAVTSTGIWSGGNGGSFNPNNSLNTVYTPTASDISSGSVLFTLTPNNVGNCLASPASILIGFTPAPTVNPGPTQTVCGNVGFVNLNGSVSISGATTTGIWSGGLGTYNPANQTVLNTKYFPTAAEISAGSVSLTLTSTNSTSGCNAVSSTVAINFSANPTVSAGGNQTVCGNSFSAITLNGTVKNAPSFNWTYNGTGSFVNTNTLTPSYTPNAADQAKGTITFKLTSSGGNCASVSDSMKISFSNAPIANAGSPINICTNAFPVQLNASGSPGSWSGGPSGNFSPNANALNAIYTPTAAQTVTGSFNLTYTTNATSGCASVSSVVTINVTQGPTVDAGNKTIVCANNPTISLTGVVSNVVGQKWSTSGTGAFSPNGNVTNPVYTPSNADISAGKVLLTFASQGGTCTNATDTLSLIINPAPVVTAMANQLFCSNISTITLSGTVSNAGGGVWRRSGSGNFNANTVSVQSISGTGNMATDYSPSVADLSSSFTISLTSSFNGLCNPVTKSFTVGFTQAPVVVAGTSRAICSDKDTLQLLGQVTNAAGGFWTSLSPTPGSFSDASILNPIYTPSASELASSSFKLRLTSQGNNGSCSSASNDVTFNVNSKPNPNAGANTPICADVSSVSLNASINFPYGSVWSSSGTGTFTGGLATSSLSSVNYFPSASDLSGGSFTIFLKSTGGTGCGQVTSKRIFTVNPIPIVNAGTDLNICADVSGVTLNGSIQNASGGVWSTTAAGGLFIPNITSPVNDPNSSNQLNAFYQPSATAKANGETIVLKLRNITSGTCADVSSSILLKIAKRPTITADPVGPVCADTFSIPVSATTFDVSGTANYTWSTSNGSGSFSPSANPLTPISSFVPKTEYRPSLTDKSIGLVNLTITTNGNGTCAPVASTVPLTITSAPVVSAGQNRTICSSKDTVQLIGTANAVVTSQQWVSSGNGTFTGVNTLTPTYKFSSADKSAGQVTFTLRSTSQGICKSVSQSIVIKISPQPVAKAGSAINICETTTIVGLSGSVTTVSGGGVWSSGGTGSFLPNNNTLNASYVPSAADFISGSVKLRLNTINSGSCSESKDSLTLTFLSKPIVKAGSDKSICADASGVSVTGTVSGAGGGVWSSKFLGTFTPNANSLTVTYKPSAAALAALVDTLYLTSTGNAPCSAITDTVVVKISPVPTVTAGPDVNFCATFDANYILSSASVSGATGIRWTTSGNGRFVASDSVTNPIYVNGATDVASGSVTLTATTYGNGPCNAVSAKMKLKYDQVPTVSAGPTVSYCMDASPLQTITLSGSVNGKTATTTIAGYTFQWDTYGSGTFVDDTQYGAAYIPSDLDKIVGNVQFKFSAVTNGSTCGSAESFTNIYLTPPPYANPGNDTSVCPDVTRIPLTGDFGVVNVRIASPGVITNGYVTSTGANFGAGTVTIPGWTDLGVGFFANGPTTATGATFYNTQVPGWTLVSPGIYTSNGVTVTNANNFVNGTATILGYTYDSGSELYISGAVSVTGSSFINGTFLPSKWSTVSGLANTFTNGLATVNGNAFWSTTSPGGSFITSNTLKQVFYVPTAADKANGQVLVTYNTTGFGNCNPASQSKLITFTPAVKAISGPNQSICSNNPTITLSGILIQGVSTISGGTGLATWSSPTGGTFSGINSLVTTFTPTASQISSGQAVVTLTPISTCSSSPSSTTITFTQPTSINAGSTILACSDASTITLNGTVGIATVGGIWSTTSAGGIFSPANTLNTTYSPTTADIANGSVVLTLTSTNNGNCSAVSSSVVVNFTPSLSLTGASLSVCADANSVSLSGFPTFSNVPGWNYLSNGFSNATNTITGGVIWTTTSSGGTFSSAPGAISTTSYNIQPADITNGSVVVKLKTTGFGSCQSKSADYIITINPSPTVKLTAPATVCGISVPFNVSGTVTGASGGVWSSASGTGSFAGTAFATALSSGTTFGTTFSPSQTQISNGKATLIFTATNTGLCNPVSSSVVVIFQSEPTLQAGSNILTCSVPSLNLSGTISLPAVSSASNPTWSTSGLGSFSAGGNTISGSNVANTYFPSPSDVASGSVQICMVSTSNGLCFNTYRSCLTVNFVTTSPGYTFSSSISTTCGNSLPIKLAAVGPTGGTWSGGLGTISGANNLNATYMPTLAEISSGAPIIFTITSSGFCGTTSATVAGLIVPGPTVGGFATPTILCKNNTVLNLNSVTISGATSGVWSTSGNGLFLQNGTSAGGKILNYAPGVQGGTLTYLPSATDVSAGNVLLKFTTSSNSNGCPSDSGIVDVQFVPFPSVNAGGNQSVCANSPTLTLSGTVTLNGTTVAGLTGFWTTTSSGTLVSTQIGTNVTGAFTASGADIASGSVKLYLRSNLTTPGVCNQVMDSSIVFITPVPVISGLATQTVCGDGTSGIVLSANLSTSAGVIWSRGSGSFSPNRQTLNAIYTPSASETGVIQLLINATSTGSNCISSTGTTNIAIQSKPTILAGGPYTICSNNLLVALSASGTGFTGGATWSIVTGNGSLSAANVTSATANYNATNVDATLGGVNLLVTSVGNGVCSAVSANTGITFINPPTISAGQDRLVCINNPTLTLSGSFGGTSPEGVQWSLGSAGTGTFTGVTTSTSAVFTATNTTSPIKIYLTSTGLNLCNAVKDSMLLSFSAAPTISGISDNMVCGDVSGLVLNANVTIASGLVWSSNGSGTFIPDRNAIKPTYVPSVAEKSGAIVTFTVTTSGNGNCSPVLATSTLTVTSIPTITASGSFVVCATNRVITLSVSGFTNASGAVWSTSGSGTFSSTNTLTGFTVYTASPSDSANGGATFKVETIGNGLCNAVSDTANLTITPSPIVNAGFNQSICADNNVITLNGSLSPYSSFGNTWTVSGGATGTITSPNSLNTTYVLSAADRALPGLNFSLTAATLGGCNLLLATSTVQVTFTPTPVVTATSGMIVCADSASVPLNGLVTIGNSTSTGIWSGGTGTFSPTVATSSPNYILSSSEAAVLTTTIVPLFYTSNNNGTCIGNYTTTVNLAINPAPQVSPPTSVKRPCENQPALPLTATGINSNLSWSSTSGTPGSFVNANPTNAQVYQPSSTEFAVGTVNIQIVANSIFAGCKDKTIVFPVSLDRQPVASAIVGGNLSVCKDVSSIKISGIVINANVTTSSWNGGFGGGIGSILSTTSFVLVPGTSNTYEASAMYFPSINDSFVTFTLNADPFDPSGNCQSTSSSLNMTFLDLPTVSTTSIINACTDANSISLTSSISTAASGVIWSTSGDGVYSDASQLITTYQPSVNEKAAGAVGLTVKTVNSNGCTDASQNVILNIAPKPLVGLTIPSTACADGSPIQLSAALTNTSSVQWSYSGSGGVFNPTPPIATTVSFTPSAADMASGALSFMATSINSNSCNPVSASSILTFQSVPTINPGVGKVICADASSVSFNGLINGAVATSSNVLWTTTGTGSFSNPNSSATTYSPSAADKPTGTSPSTVVLNLTYNDPGKCGRVSQFVVLTITSAPVVTASIGDECSYLTGVPLVGNVQFGGSSSTGIWTSNGSGSFSQSSNNPNATYVPSSTDIQNGSVKLTFTSTNQGTCNAVSSSLNLLIRKLPLAFPGKSQTVCVGSTVILVASSNKDVQYNWSVKNAGGSTTQISTSKTASYTVNGTTTFLLKVIDASGCEDTASVVVNTITPPSFGLNNHYCFVLPLTLKGSPTPSSPSAMGIPTNSFPTYLWYRNDTLVSTLSDSLSVTSPGQHKITFNYEGCSVSSVAGVTSPPVVNGNDRVLCENTNTTLAVNSIPKASYGWYYNGTGGQLSPTSASSLNTTVQNGFYLVHAVDSLGCFANDSLFTKTVPKPIIKIAPVSGACVNDTAILSGLASNIDTTVNKPRYDWYVGSFIYVNDTIHSKVSVTQSARYKLVYSIGECKSSDSTDVVFNPRPITNLLHNRDMCEESDSIVGIVLDGGDGITYKWKATNESPNKKYYTGDSTRSITIKKANKYYYVQVFNEFKCSTKDSVYVLNACEPRVFPADAFTPNGDDRNNEYVIHNKYVGDFEFTVFSRWGEIIYHTNDPSKPWDGKFKGDDMPAGVYPWTMTYSGDTGKYKGPYKKVGKVTVIR